MLQQLLITYKPPQNYVNLNLLCIILLINPKLSFKVRLIIAIIACIALPLAVPICLTLNVTMLLFPHLPHHLL